MGGIFMPKETVLEQFAKRKNNVNLPRVMVSGSGEAWFLNPETRSMERMWRGTVVQKVAAAPDKDGRHLVKMGVIYVLIPEEELFDIGEN